MDNSTEYFETQHDHTVRLDSFDAICSTLTALTTFSADVAESLKSPLTERQLYSLDNAVLPYRNGVWNYVETYGAAPTYSYLILHWPLILQRAVQCVNYPSRRHNPAYAALSKRLHEVLFENADGSTDDYIRLMEALEYHVLRKLPGGITVPTPHPLKAFLSLRAKAEKDPRVRQNYHNVTVIRFGAFFSVKDNHLDTAFTQYAPLTAKALLRLDTRLLLHVPRVVRLLYWVLTQAGHGKPGDGWNKWGLYWSRGQLFFNCKVALDTVYAAEERPAYFEGMSKEVFSQDMLGQPANRKSIRLRDVPPFSTWHMLPTAKTSRHDSFIRSMAWVNQALSVHAEDDDERYTNVNNFIIFKLDSPMSLTHYFSALLNMNTVHVTRLVAEPYAAAPTTTPTPSMSMWKATDVVDTSVSPPEAAVSLRVYEPRAEFIINAVHFNALIKNCKFIPMTFSILKHRGEDYISLPLELVRQFPLLSKEDHPFHLVLKAAHRQELIIKDNIAHYAASLFGHKELFWGPMGEAHPEMKEDVHKVYVRAVKHFGQWLHTKVENYSWRAEFKVVNKECSCQLKTVGERIQFFRNKGKSLAKRHVLRASEKGQRSARLNSYDKFIFWYAAQEELSVVEGYVPPEVHAEYLTRRWMPWRTPAANMPYLETTQEMRARKNGRAFSTAAELLAHIDEQGWEVPFTQDAPRTGPLVPGELYAYEEDRIQNTLKGTDDAE